MMQNGRKIAAVASSVLLFAGMALADGRTDYYTQTNQQRYFNMPEKARDYGMAGASVPTDTDSSSVISNPSGLGFMKDAEVSATYFRDNVSGNDANWNDIETSYDGGHVLAAIPLMPELDSTPRWGTLGFGWTGWKSDTDNASDDDGKGYGLTVAYGKDISDTMSLGYGVTYQQKKNTFQTSVADVSGKMDDGITHNVGLQYKLSPATRWALSSKYGSGTYEYEATTPGGSVIEIADEDIRSWGAATGLAHQMGPTGLFFAVDYTNYRSKADDDSFAWGFRTGVEQAFTDWLKGRLGYRYQANFDYDAVGDGEDNAKYNAFAFGAGVKLMKNLFADYGAEYRAVGHDDWLHSVTLSVPFSMCVD